jgi:hypothetical protein
VFVEPPGRSSGPVTKPFNRRQKTHSRNMKFVFFGSPSPLPLSLLVFFVARSVRAVKHFLRSAVRASLKIFVARCLPGRSQSFCVFFAARPLPDRLGAPCQNRSALTGNCDKSGLESGCVVVFEFGCWFFGSGHLPNDEEHCRSRPNQAWTRWP